MSQYSVAILHHETAPWDILKGSLLFALAKRWQNEGVTVHHLFGTRSYVGADVAFVHVDLSVVPDDYLEFARQYPLVVNLHGTDIRKRGFSMLRVSSHDSDYDGPVIVKTNLNYGGRPERMCQYRLDSRPMRLARRVAQSVRRRIPRTQKSLDIMNPYQYRVYDSPLAVPDRVYRNPNLLVERFVPEQRGDYYFHRRYYFLPGAEVNQCWKGHSPICYNDHDGVSTDVDVPPFVRRFREDFGIEFGKIDYVLSESGQPYVLDVNRTPHVGNEDPHKQWKENLCRKLHVPFDQLISTLRGDTFDAARSLANIGHDSPHS